MSVSVSVSVSVPVSVSVSVCLLSSMYVLLSVGSWSFYLAGPKTQGFLSKINCSQMKLLSFVN